MATTKNTYTQSGSTTDYSFTFPYIKQSDVKVSLDNVVKTLTTDYTFANATTVSFNSAPTAGAAIAIYRSTDDSGLVATFYPGSAIRSADLNDNYTQNLYSTQENTNDSTEALDNSRELADGVYTSAISIANTAKTTADNSVDDADAAKLATDRLVATTSDGGSTWTLAGGNTNASTDPKGVKYAVDEAEAAVAAAAVADGVADNAKLATDRLVATTSDSGSTWTVAGNNTNASTDPKGVGWAITQGEAGKESGDAAKLASDRLVATTSDGGSTWTLAGNNTNASTDPKGVGYAITTAEGADAIADNAKLATDRLVATTSDGGSTWTLTGNNTNASTDPKGVGYAVAQAEAAVATADQATADVADALLYTSVANKTALEALTPSADGDYQVNDSTGLVNATWGIYTLSGLGSSYPTTQLSGIVTKLSYTHSSNTFAFVSYSAIDSDDRYMVGPVSDGNANEVLTTNGSGVFTWEVGGNVTIDAGNFDTGASLVSSTVTYDGGEFT